MNLKQLIEACIKNDKKAQKSLFDRYSDLILRVCYRYVKSQFDAEDLAINTFTKAFQSIDSIQYFNEKSFVGWLKKIAINECLMLLRKKNNFHLVVSDYVEFQESDLSPLVDLQAADLYQLIADLPIGYRTVFNLFVIEGYSHKEISEKLSINEGTSRSQLKKARNLLAKTIEKEGGNYGT